MDVVPALIIDGASPTAFIAAALYVVFGTVQSVSDAHVSFPPLVNDTAELPVIVVPQFVPNWILAAVFASAYVAAESSTTNATQLPSVI